MITLALSEMELKFGIGYDFRKAMYAVTKQDDYEKLPNNGMVEVFINEQDEERITQ